MHKGILIKSDETPHSQHTPLFNHSFQNATNSLSCLNWKSFVSVFVTPTNAIITICVITDHTSFQVQSNSDRNLIPLCIYSLFNIFFLFVIIILFEQSVQELFGLFFFHSVETTFF